MTNSYPCPKAATLKEDHKDRHAKLPHFEEQQRLILKLLNDLNAPIAFLQECRLRGQPTISIPPPQSTPNFKPRGYTLLTGDADDRGVGGCGIAIRSDLARSITRFGSEGNRLAWAMLRDGTSSVWLISAHSPTESATEAEKEDFYDKFFTLICSLPSSHLKIIGINANCQLAANLSLLAICRWFHPGTETSNNGSQLIDVAEELGLYLATTVKKTPWKNKFTWYGSTKLSDEEKRARKISKNKKHKIQINQDFLQIIESEYKWPLNNLIEKWADFCARIDDHAKQELSQSSYQTATASLNLTADRNQDEVSLISIKLLVQLLHKRMHCLKLSQLTGSTQSKKI
uniref:Endonuclease/exonuclease/phosphatase domain-containing protein n=1 Tax=Plectus sambesii TaxID=2011161 RepID=A0A914V2R7_9BILA